jgi:hypothetical protein
MTASWYVEHDGNVYGPFSSARLKQLATGSKIRPETRLRRGADGNWVLASQVKGLLDRAESKPQRLKESETAVASQNATTANDANPAAQNETGNPPTAKARDEIETVMKELDPAGCPSQGNRIFKHPFFKGSVAFLGGILILWFIKVVFALAAVASAGSMGDQIADAYMDGQIALLETPGYADLYTAADRIKLADAMEDQKPLLADHIDANYSGKTRIAFEVGRPFSDAAYAAVGLTPPTPRQLKEIWVKMVEEMVSREPNNKAFQNMLARERKELAEMD